MDVDARMIAEGAVTEMALGLDLAMARNPEARARYEAIYGRPWVSLVDIELASMERYERSLATTRV